MCCSSIPRSWGTESLPSPVEQSSRTNALCGEANKRVKGFRGYCGVMIRLWVILLLTASGVVAQDTSSADRAAVVPVLVELFTSEGCSSCPPVDRWLQKMDSSQPVPGAQLIVLSEHVDYWDHDGWKDPFSSSTLTDRQSAYASKLGLATVYTPQVIVDGTSELRANDSQQVNQVFRKTVTKPKIPVRITSVSTEVGVPLVAQVHVEIDGTSTQRDADIYMALALDHVESEVLRGENSGQRLSYVAVVQSLTRVGKLQKGRKFDQDVQMKLRRGSDPTNVRMIVFVQDGGPGEVLGATSERLSDQKPR